MGMARFYMNLRYRDRLFVDECGACTLEDRVVEKGIRSRAAQRHEAELLVEAEPTHPRGPDHRLTSPALNVRQAASRKWRQVGSTCPAAVSRSQSSTVTEPFRKVISPSPLRSCKVRFTCTVERPSASPNSAWVSGNSYTSPFVSPTALRRTYNSHKRWAIRP